MAERVEDAQGALVKCVSKYYVVNCIFGTTNEEDIGANSYMRRAHYICPRVLRNHQITCTHRYDIYYYQSTGASRKTNTNFAHQ